MTSTRILAIILAISLIFIVGCIEPGYVPHREIVITKLTSDGFPEWTKVIDDQKDISAHDVIQTSDNVFVIAGDHSRLIALSDKGEILWNREYVDPYCGSDLIVGKPDNMVTIFSSGSICQIDDRGEVVWNRSVGIGGFTALATEDGGFVIAGSEVTKLDPEVNVTWKASVGKNQSTTIIEMNNKSGYLVGTFSTPSFGKDQLNIIKFDPNGVIVNTTEIALTDTTIIDNIQETPEGYIALYVDDTVKENVSGTDFPRYISVHLDQNGAITDRQTVFIAELQIYLTATHCVEKWNLLYYQVNY